MKSLVDEAMIDSLVCGSLTDDQYRRAIGALDADPQRWRDCALAFLQEQAITQELKELSQANVDWHQTDCNVSTLRSLSISPVASQRAQEDEIGWPYKVGRLAALLLLSFSMGWAGSSMRDNSELTNSPPLTDPSTLSPQLAGGAPRFKLDTMSVEPTSLSKNASTFKFGSNSNSLVGNMNTMLPIDEEIPENLARLEREGRIRIESTTAIMPLECDSGTVLVPVQQLRVVPVMFSY